MTNRAIVVGLIAFALVMVHAWANPPTPPRQPLAKYPNLVDPVLEYGAQPFTPDSPSVASERARQIADRREAEGGPPESGLPESDIDDTPIIPDDVVEAPPQPEVVTISWSPFDECGDIRNPGPVVLTPATLSWCRMVVMHLQHYDWQPGDLHRLLLIIECESNGNPDTINRSSDASGLFQHLPKYFYTRAAKSGIEAPANITNPHDNIHTGVWLFKSDGDKHWPNCGGNTNTETSRLIRQTLANLGY